MAGVALFDSALVAYPLYQTSKHILNTRAFNLLINTDDGEYSHETIADNYQAADRWLTFWLTFGLIELVQGFGAGDVPGFHLAKGAVLLSLYSVEHATVISALLPRVCASYVQCTDRARQYWSEAAVPQVRSSSTSWFTGVQSKLYGVLGIQQQLQQKDE